MSPTHLTRNPNVTMPTFWWSRWTIRHGCPPQGQIAVPSRGPSSQRGSYFQAGSFNPGTQKKPSKSHRHEHDEHGVRAHVCLTLSRSGLQTMAAATVATGTVPSP